MEKRYGKMRWQKWLSLVLVIVISTGLTAKNTVVAEEYDDYQNNDSLVVLENSINQEDDTFYGSDSTQNLDSEYEEENQDVFDVSRTNEENVKKAIWDYCHPKEGLAAKTSFYGSDGYTDYGRDHQGRQANG